MALELIKTSNGGRPVPCYLHPGMFRQRALPLPGGRASKRKTEEVEISTSCPVVTMSEAAKMMDVDRSTVSNAKLGPAPWAEKSCAVLSRRTIRAAEYLRASIGELRPCEDTQ